MLVYRITLKKYAAKLHASGNAARWNSKEVKLIYTSGSRALACLENLVHRGNYGANDLYRVMVIDIPGNIHKTIIERSELKKNWKAFENYPYTRQIGDDWIKQAKTTILQVPSAIIPEESNFLLNPMHKDFKKIKIIGNYPFEFDERF